MVGVPSLQQIFFLLGFLAADTHNHSCGWRNQVITEHILFSYRGHCVFEWGCARRFFPGPSGRLPLGLFPSKPEPDVCHRACGIPAALKGAQRCTLLLGQCVPPLRHGHRPMPLRGPL